MIGTILGRELRAFLQASEGRSGPRCDQCPFAHKVYKWDSAPLCCGYPWLTRVRPPRQELTAIAERISRTTLMPIFVEQESPIDCPLRITGSGQRRRCLLEGEGA